MIFSGWRVKLLTCGWVLMGSLMNLENLECLKLNSLNSLNSLITTIIGATSNFLSEGVRLGLDMKIARMGHTWRISHSGY